MVGSYQALGRATAEVETIEYYLGVEGSWRTASSEVNKTWNFNWRGNCVQVFGPYSLRTLDFL